MKPLRLLFIFIPLAIFTDRLYPDKPLIIFILSGLAIVPLAAAMGRATEQLADRLGEGVGGLLNATFGNAAEFIIALAALRAGLYDVVKTSLLGTIIGNTLFVVGASMFAGGFYHHEQKFNAEATNSQATMLMLAAMALIVPALFVRAVGSPDQETIQSISLTIAVLLLIGYGLNLLFSLGTHRKLFEGEPHKHKESGGEHWTVRKASAALALTAIFVAWMSELLVGSVEPAAEILGLNYLFVGVFLLAFLGSAAEQVAAVSAAIKGRMDLSLSIAIGSSVQISLLVIPLMVILSYFIGPAPMDILFGPGGVSIIFMSVLIVNQIASDGHSHWLKGAQLLLLYLILAAVFLFLPDKPTQASGSANSSEAPR